MYKKLCYLGATFCGIGYSKFAPGTMGSLATLPFVWLFTHFFGLWGLLFLIVASFIKAIVTTKEVLKYTKHDPSFVVIDEFVGQSVAFLFVVNYLHIWWVWVIGFALFRFFDIVKIGPVKYFDTKVNNAFGVVMDDVVAGFFAAIVLAGFVFGLN